MPQFIRRSRSKIAFWLAIGLRGVSDILRGLWRNDAAYPVYVPACGRSLWVRRGTTDLIVLRQALPFRKGFVPPGYVPRTVLDLGANVGMTPSVFAARWPDAKVVAVEPESGNFKLLQSNCSPVPTIAPVQAAVWGKDTQLEISNPTARAWEFRVQESANSGWPSPRIPGYSIATLMQLHALDNLDVVKIDIEGAEKEIFEGDVAAWLPRVQTLIVELHDRFRPGCSEALDAALAGYPHKRFKRGEYDVFHFDPIRP